MSDYGIISRELFDPMSRDVCQSLDNSNKRMVDKILEIESIRFTVRMADMHDDAEGLENTRKSLFQEVLFEHETLVMSVQADAREKTVDFVKWLNRLPEEQIVEHIYECPRVLEFIVFPTEDMQKAATMRKL